MSLEDELNALVSESEVIYKQEEPFWQGPSSDHKQGGITFSLLSRYLVCKERFRIHTIEGLRTRDVFNHRLEYGNMWHLCEEVYARHKQLAPALINLLGFAQQLAKKYPLQQEEIDKWYNVCRIQFPIYVEFCSKKEDKNTENINLFSEKVFNCKYILPSGRYAVLRGKWDSVFVDTENSVIVAQENKTKGDIDKESIEKQLSFDLQTMIYLITLDEYVNSPEFPLDIDPPMPVGGVLYNVVRRPLSGGRGNIKQLQGSKNRPGESKEQYFNRLKSVIDGTGDYETEPGYFFMRWNVGIDTDDIMRFKATCLDPILENLLDDYEWYVHCHTNEAHVFDYLDRNHVYPKHMSRQYIMPYGIYSTLLEGTEGPLDDYIRNGSTTGLEKTTNLFPELQ